MNLLRQLKKIEHSIIEMKNSTVQMYQLLSEVIVDQDKEKIRRIEQLDELVNEHEEIILEETIVGLALLAPVATDLRVMVSCIRISNEMERIADYAKNIAEFFGYAQFHSKTLINTTQQLITEIVNDFSLVVDSFINRDVKIAYEMKDKIKRYNQKFEQFFNIMNEKEQGTLAELYPVYTTFKSLDRAKDHMINMCESLLYLQTGKFYNID